MSAVTQPPDGLAELGIEEVKVARLEPGDVIVLMAPKRLTMDEAETIRERAAEFFAEHRVAVLEGGLSIEVLRAAPGNGPVELEWTAPPSDAVPQLVEKFIRGRGEPR